MKLFGISTALCLLAAFASAAPTPASAAPAPANEARLFSILIQFQGAAGAYFELSFPADGTVITITNVLSISHIKSYGGGTCTFYGINKSTTTVVGAQTVDVGPPQTQVRGVCRAF